MVPNAQFGIGYINPADPNYDRGHCDGDRTHLANGTVGYLTPDVDNGFLGVLASNWRLSGIVNARSGSWMSVLSGRDGAFNGQANQRVDRVSDDVRRQDAGELPIERPSRSLQCTLARTATASRDPVLEDRLAVSRLGPWRPRSPEFRVEVQPVISTGAIPT
jgi:hypothetical protein